MILGWILPIGKIHLICSHIVRFMFKHDMSLFDWHKSIVTLCCSTFCNIKITKLNSFWYYGSSSSKYRWYLTNTLLEFKIFLLRLSLQTIWCYTAESNLLIFHPVGRSFLLWCLLMFISMLLRLFYLRTDNLSIYMSTH